MVGAELLLEPLEMRLPFGEMAAGNDGKDIVEPEMAVEHLSGLQPSKVVAFVLLESRSSPAT